MLYLLPWGLQGTIPTITSTSQAGISGRRSLLLLDDNGTLEGGHCAKEEEPAIATDKAGLAHLLDNAASGYAALLQGALSPVKSSLVQMQRLVTEVRRSGVGSGRSLLQSSCGDLGDMSQSPNGTSSIVPLSQPDVTCNLETITAETVIMANILGAVASTASAVTAMQVQ